MRTLTANDAIRIWEKGQRQQPAQRALSLLSAACPEESQVELRRLTLGQCEDRLWEARKRILGSEVNGFSECSACGERLEFTLDTDNFRSPSSSESPSEFVFNSDGYTIRFRLLDLEDLDVTAAAGNVDAVREQLIERCVLEARRGEEPVAAAELPEHVVAELGRRLAEFDSGAEVLIELTCPACAAQHQLPLDISSFFFSEISFQAQRLLREVHVLASAYGWRESEILELSARRRQFYLEMVQQ
jgi:hypothetical protein